MDRGRSQTILALGCIVISDLLGVPLGASDVIAPSMLRGLARVRVVLIPRHPVSALARQ